jgi:hypothetical protein
MRPGLGDSKITRTDFDAQAGIQALDVSMLPLVGNSLVTCIGYDTCRTVSSNVKYIALNMGQVRTCFVDGNNTFTLQQGRINCGRFDTINICLLARNLIFWTLFLFPLKKVQSCFLFSWLAPVLIQSELGSSEQTVPVC